MANIPNIKFNDGNEMPQVGFVPHTLPHHSPRFASTMGSLTERMREGLGCGRSPPNLPRTWSIMLSRAATACLTAPSVRPSPPGPPLFKNRQADRLTNGLDYGNEKECGQGVKRALDEGLVKREELFIASKLWNTFHEAGRVEPIVRQQLEWWGLEYVSLPLPRPWC